MIPSLRQSFNQAFTPAKYQEFLRLVDERVGVPTLFRLNETPCFLPAGLVSRMAAAGKEMTEALLADPEYRQAVPRSIPARYCVPNEDAKPLFVQADFGVDEAGNPKLVEIQGFPSLYAYQPVLAGCYADVYDIQLPYLPGGLSLSAYYGKVRRAIVGSHDPEHVILLEIDPLHQKTLPDFVETERICNIKTVDIRDIRKHGNRLTYGNGIPVQRIYNRAIVDELVRREIALPFDFRDDLDVEWAGHPNWFFKLSKFSLPFMKHPAVPETHFLDEVGRVAQPEDWVLKPLFSFAGLGVVVGPTEEQIEQARGKDFILQRRVSFAPVIQTPQGMTKMEVRIMYIWRDELEVVNTIIRTGRGAQMGVDHNKNLEWVGASAAFLA